MSTELKFNGFWQGILIGGVVATVTVLLYAPKVGKQVRYKFSELFKSRELHTINHSTETTSTPINQTINSMAQNEHEMAKLGHEMKYMKTNAQVKESGMVPDPIQNE